MFQQIHELVDVANKVDAMLNVDPKDCRIFVVDDKDNETEDIQDLLMGVQTMIELIQES